MSSACIRCFGAHHMKKVFHRKETEVRPWIQSSDMDKWGKQDVTPAERVVSRRQSPE